MVTLLLTLLLAFSIQEMFADVRIVARAAAILLLTVITGILPRVYLIIVPLI